ncbi:MAG: hypothetical protein P8M13_03600 [Luminiphilus sp.]|nr:hypothetical protein [Luminiphilus sp.]
MASEIEPEHVQKAPTADSGLIAAASRSPSIWKPALKEAAWSFLAAAILLSILYSLAFSRIHPEFVPFIGQDARLLSASGNNLIPVSVGKGRKDSVGYVIESFNGDEAILALPRAFRAEDYPFIKVNLSGFTRYSKAKILWQQAGDPTTHGLELNRSGDQVTQIAMVYGGEHYSGSIQSIALLFFDGPALGFENNDDADVIIDSIELRPFSAKHVVEQIVEDWTNPPLWQGYSNNIVRGIHANGMLFPNAVANLLVVTGLLMAAFFRLVRKLRSAAMLEHQLVATVLCLCLYGWVFNDVLRWYWRVEQLIDSHERYAGLPLDERIRNNKIRCSQFPEDCAVYLLPYF